VNAVKAPDPGAMLLEIVLLVPLDYVSKEGRKVFIILKQLVTYHISGVFIDVLNLEFDIILYSKMDYESVFTNIWFFEIKSLKI
ncbi:unnamed protein product, partial [marine sediment metagenome]